MSNRTTVIVPFLNGNNEDYLAATLRSVPYGTLWIVARNDGEMAQAMNEALAKVDTEFVCAFGADDLFHHDTLDMLESVGWDGDVMYPTMILTQEDGETPIGAYPATPFCPYRLQRWNFVTGASLLRTSKVREIGGWRQLKGLEDWELMVRLSAAGARFKPVPEATFRYRQVPGSRNKMLGKDNMTKESWREYLGIEPDPVKATFYCQATPATTYWRCQLPARYLPAQVLPEVTVTNDGTYVELMDHEGAAVFQFPGDAMRDIVATQMLPFLRERSIVEVDDNYLVSAPQRKQQGWHMRIGEGAHTVEQHRRTVEGSSAVIVTTEFLARSYRKVNPNVYICPNQIDPSDWPTAEKKDDGVLRFGWWASRSHKPDIPLVTRAMEWASRQPNVEVVTMGLDPGWRFARRQIPWSNDMATYWRMMVENVDVGLAPIVPNPWSNCRSDLKALEYGMAGALPIVSTEAPYSEWQDGERCLTAADAKEFLHKVKWCVQHRDEVKQLAADAKKYVLEERTMEHNIWRWHEAIDGTNDEVPHHAELAAAA